MFRILLLVCALLFVGGASQSAEAARPSAYARAKMRGHIFTHRPVYKYYKGNKIKKARKHRFFGKRHQAPTRQHRSSRYTVR